MRVGAGDDPRRIAAMLKRSTKQPNDSNRAIHYGPSGVAQQESSRRLEFGSTVRREQTDG